MGIWDDILGRGYFPKELPPSFSTISLGRAIDSARNAIPSQLITASYITAPIKYNLARPGTLRRPLRIPNPVNQIRLAKTIEDNWTSINTHLNKSMLSRSRPVHPPQGVRAFDNTTPRGELPAIRARAWSRSRYVLKADISQFYPTIYTHSIPWSLHTKQIAKQNRNSASYFGNVIDRHVREGQDSQTVGIPIGPDTSLVIAEIILASIDESLSTQLPLLGHRYFDDYEVAFSSITQAEDALTYLQEYLADYELVLNPMKTEILELPLPIDRAWVSKIRTFIIATPNQPDKQKYDLIHFFNSSIEESKINRLDPVLRYALARLRGETIAQQNWSLVENLILQCMLTENGCIEFTSDLLLRARHHGNRLDVTAIAYTLELLIQRHYVLGHSSEVAWAIWMHLALNIPMSANEISCVSVMEDPIVAMLALHARSVQLIPTATTFQHWETWMTQDHLMQSEWIIAYEALNNNWLPSLNGSDYVVNDANFNWLRSQGVTFYNANVVNQILSGRMIHLGRHLVPTSTMY